MLSSVSEVLDMMGHGMRLRVPHDSAQSPTLRRTYPKSFETATDVLVHPDILPNLTSQLYKLSELGEPPTQAERRKQGSWRVGWRESGYDGDVADWYCFKQ